MDRYVVREPRLNADYPRGNQMIAFSTNSAGNAMVTPEGVYYSGVYGTEFPNMQRVASSGFIGVTQMNAPSLPNTNVQGQVVSGIDPRYLSAYSDGNASFIATGKHHLQTMNPVPVNATFGNEYQNRNFVGPDRNKSKTFLPQVISAAPFQSETSESKTSRDSNTNNIQAFISNAPKKPIETDSMKSEVHSQVMTRADKLKALYKSGPRVFSGPVEKVLKWHKTLQDIGVSVLYEIVAKCVNVRPGDSCAKNLVVRDDNGPAMQVVYYEIDFLLPELKPPCTVRVVGRMMMGTCRLQAFSVRPAIGDDIAMLPRRAAAAAHHVAKLSKEFNITV